MDLIRQGLHLALALAAFWLILSGHYEGLLLASGGLSVVLVIVITHRMGVVDGMTVHVRLPLRAPLYAGWLAWQILSSSMVVLRQVWSPRLAPRPAVGAVPAASLSEPAAVAYANSITLTPGTLSLQVHDSAITVHALHKRGLDELRSGQMLARLRRLDTR